MEAARAAPICSIARPARPDRRTRCLDEPRECRAAEFINLVGKETYRSRAFANVAGKLAQNLVLGRPGRGQCFSASVERLLSSFAWALRRLNLLQQPIFPTCRVPRLRTCRRAGPDSIWAARSATAWIAFDGEIWVRRRFFRRRIR